jgi:solute carrier family 35 protein E1
MVLIWYLFAIGAVTMSKKIMMEVQLPSMLCTCQFISAAIATKMLEDVMGDSFSAHSPSQSLIQDKVSVPVGRRGGRPNNFMWQMAQIALSYTFGFIFTNLAFSVVTASFAETVKSAEPISSVLMGFVVLNEVASLPTYLTLIPICAGVAISCFHDDSFAFNGFLYAAASNICFSGRAVLAKRLLKQYPGSISEVEMFRLISLMGLVVLVPLTIISEGTDIYAFFSGDATMTQTYWELLSLLFLNGCAYAVYNLTSFLVLARTSLVTHAVLNCFRRVFIIVFTSYYFNVEISQFNMLGVALAVLGVMLFAYCKDFKGSNKGESDRE